MNILERGEDDQLKIKSSICLAVLTLILLPTCGFVQEISAELTLGAGDLPNETQTLTVTSNTTLTINPDENATSTGAIYIQSVNDTKPTLQIINNGELTIKSYIMVTGGNLTIRNAGKLTLTNQNITLTGNATLTILNTGVMNLNKSGLLVYGGVADITNKGTLSGFSWQLKDQYDGTRITNNGTITLEECSFTANGAHGQYIINNYGNLVMAKTHFDANYGGSIDLNSLYGNLSMQSGGMEASGWSHGKQSSLTIMTSIANWTNTTINCHEGSSTYYDYGLGGTVHNCTFSYIGNYNQIGNKNYTDCTINNIGNFWNAGNATYSNCKIKDTHNMSNNGNLTLKNVSLDIGNQTNLSNLGSLQLLNTVFNSSGTLNFLNQGIIYADGWMIKTQNASSTVNLTNKVNITFTQSFIEGVSNQTLTSLGPNATTFNQTSGGKIVIINQGSILLYTNIIPEMTGVITITLLVPATSIIVVFFTRKRSQIR